MPVRDLWRLFGRYAQATPSGDHAREQSFMALVVLTSLGAWLWTGATLQSQQLDPLAAMALIAGILGANWLIHHLRRSHPLAGTGVFLTSMVAYTTAMLCLLRVPSVSYLFALSIVSGALLGPAGTLAMAVVALATEITVTVLSPGLIPAGMLLQQIALYTLLAAAATDIAIGMYRSLQSAEESAQQASAHAEEARRRRGELQSTLKSLDLAWEQLQRANSELFQAREAADASLRFKSEFAAQISHELRTSLNLILGFSETMAFSPQAYGAKLPAAYLHDVSEIHRNSQHLLTLIDDILDLSKLDAGKMGLHREIVHLAPMLREAAEIARPLVERKGLELVLQVPQALPPLLLDRTRMRQVVLNLLSNAVRATSQGRIGISAQEEDGQVIVRVADTGVGIAPEVLERVFEEFHQLENQPGTKGAAGLGLAVSKRIVALHGGRMWAESTQGAGSTFSMALPLPGAPAFSATVRTSGPKPGTPEPGVVLVGEEGGDEARLLQRHLENYAILTAPTLEEAARTAAQAGARAVILNAPLSQIAEPVRLPVPLIACPLPGPQQAARLMHVVRLIQKPVTSEAVLTALRDVPDGASLLIVDDEPSAVRLVERMILGGGRTYRLFRAYSGQEALARVHAQRPDAMVLDLAMPNGDGTWLLSALRQDPRLATVPVILVTGRPVEEMWQSGPIGILSSVGFTPTEALSYLQALLSVVPPATALSHRS